MKNILYISVSSLAVIWILGCSEKSNNGFDLEVSMALNNQAMLIERQKIISAFDHAKKIEFVMVVDGEVAQYTRKGVFVITEEPVIEEFAKAAMDISTIYENKMRFHPFELPKGCWIDVITNDPEKDISLFLPFRDGYVYEYGQEHAVALNSTGLWDTAFKYSKSLQPCGGTFVSKAAK